MLFVDLYFIQYSKMLMKIVLCNEKNTILHAMKAFIFVCYVFISVISLVHSVYQVII